MKIGDRVKVISDANNNEVIGMIGIIVIRNERYNSWGVEFGMEFMDGHTLDGKLNSNRGRYFNECKLKLVCSNKVKPTARESVMF